MSEVAKKHPHYHKDVSHLETVDVYRVLSLFNVTDPCIQHALKKLLVAGGRGAGKDISRDVEEAIHSLQRWQEMRQEDGKMLLSDLARIETGDAHPARATRVDPVAGDAQPVHSGNLLSIWTVKDIDARDAIPAAGRKKGLHVMTLEPKATWVLGEGLSNADWLLAVL